MRTVIVNFSGGKDSTEATLKALKVYPKEEIVLCFQDTGAEYFETEAHVNLIADLLELPLVVLRRDELFWDLVKRFSVFPGPQSRFCTTKLKKDAVRSWVAKNRTTLGDELIIVTGLRGEESVARSKLSEWAIDDHLTTKNQTVKLWAPCLHMRKQEVIDRVKAEGLPLHPCYEFSDRCSCWMCIFQPWHVVRTYAEMHPDLYEKACLIEDEIKHKWKEHFAINDLMNQRRLL